jgi:crotonobetainyl-CoA:carnitine CoA-transferase CaiB-like acyl-CoA transferase
MAELDTRPGPLDGLLVADFSRVLAGPYCTMLLADLGADVIKVESPGGDDTRGWVPPTRDGVATYYLAINRNKRSVVLDLRDPAGRAAAAELARRADIMVQNFKPGGLARFRHHRRGPSAGVRPDGAGRVRPDEPDRRGGRPAAARGHLRD